VSTSPVPAAATDTPVLADPAEPLQGREHAPQSSYPIEYVVFAVLLALVGGAFVLVRMRRGG